MELKETKELLNEHWDLLFLADPSREMIDQYINEGIVFEALMDNELVGIVVLVKNSVSEIEIKNIAVNPLFQGKGYAKQIIEFAKKESIRLGFSKLIICTGNSSILQLALYQKCGFRMKEITHDFFLQKYEVEIWENGIQCKDLVKLEHNLES